MEICNNLTCGFAAAESVFQAAFGFVATELVFQAACGFVAAESVCSKQLVALRLRNLSVSSDLWLHDYGICPRQAACGFMITESGRASRLQQGA